MVPRSLKASRPAGQRRDRERRMNFEQELKALVDSYASFSPVVEVEGGVTYVLFPKLYTPEGKGAEEAQDVLFSCNKIGGYNNKLFIERIVHRKPNVRWKDQSHCILGRTWYSFSFQTTTGTLKERFLDHYKEVVGV